MWGAMNNIVPVASEPSSTGPGQGASPKRAFEESSADGPLVPLADALEMSPFAFQVPPTVYGSAALVGVLLECESWLDWVEKVGAVYGMLLLNVVVQALLCVSLLQLVRWQEDTIKHGDECFRLFGVVLVLCLWIFFCSILTEIAETLYLAEVVMFQVPTVEGRSQCLKYLAAPGGPMLKGGGMSRNRKGCIVSFVVLPKLLLGLVMFIVGGLFLTKAGSNMDLFLNSLAAVFILETDEMIFSYLTPGAIRRLVEEIPPFDTGGQARHVLLRRIMFVSRLAVSGAATAIFFAARSDCQNDPCEGSFGACPVMSVFGV